MSDTRATDPELAARVGAVRAGDAALAAAVAELERRMAASGVAEGDEAATALAIAATLRAECRRVGHEGWLPAADGDGFELDPALAAWDEPPGLRLRLGDLDDLCRRQESVRARLDAVG